MSAFDVVWLVGVFALAWPMRQLLLRVFAVDGPTDRLDEGFATFLGTTVALLWPIVGIAAVILTVGAAVSRLVWTRKLAWPWWSRAPFGS